MGIPTTAFQTGDLYIEYWNEDILFRYENATGRFFANPTISPMKLKSPVAIAKANESRAYYAAVRAAAGG